MRLELENKSQDLSAALTGEPMLTKRERYLKALRNEVTRVKDGYMVGGFISALNRRNKGASVSMSAGHGMPKERLNMIRGQCWNVSMSRPYLIFANFKIGSSYF